MEKKINTHRYETYRNQEIQLMDITFVIKGKSTGGHVYSCLIHESTYLLIYLFFHPPNIYFKILSPLVRLFGHIPALPCAKYRNSSAAYRTVLSIHFYLIATK